MEYSFYFDSPSSSFIYSWKTKDGNWLIQRATEWAVANLLNHPEVLKKKAKTELDILVGDHLMNESDFAELQYLQCIISEDSRLYILRLHHWRIQSSRLQPPYLLVSRWSEIRVFLAHFFHLKLKASESLLEALTTWTPWFTKIVPFHLLHLVANTTHPSAQLEFPWCSEEEDKFLSACQIQIQVNNNNN